jgi:hypothetical protein
MVTEIGASVQCLEAATEHLRRILNSPTPAPLRQGSAAIFQISSLDLVAERFGAHGVHYLHSAIFNCLAEKLQKEDTLYHWTGSSLLAICERPVYESQLTAELSRILARNRDFPIQVGERRLMLRIPISLTVHPLSKLSSLCDLLPDHLRGDDCMQTSHFRINGDFPAHALVAGIAPESLSEGQPNE